MNTDRRSPDRLKAALQASTGNEPPHHLGAQAACRARGKQGSISPPSHAPAQRVSRCHYEYFRALHAPALSDERKAGRFCLFIASENSQIFPVPLLCHYCDKLCAFTGAQRNV